MLSFKLSNILFRRNVYYGWVAAAVTFLTMLVMSGALGAPGVFVVPLQNEFNWNAAEVSSALAVRFALFGLTGIVLGATVATRWFSTRRGLVVGMMSASSATGQLVFLPLLANVTEYHGWRFALTMVLLGLGAAVAVVILLMRNHPAELGLRPFGATDDVPVPADRLSFSQMFLTPLTVLRDVSGNRSFWILFGTFFICGATTNGLVQTHFISMCGDYGIAAVAAAGVLAVMGICDFFGTIGSGWLSDRVDNRKLLFWYYGLRSLSLLYLPHSDFSFYGLSIFAVFYGLDWIATVPQTVKLIVDRFGAARASVVFGWVFAGHQMGAACGAYGGGLSRTVLSSYLPAYLVAGGLWISAALAVLILPRPGSVRVARRSATA